MKNGGFSLIEITVAIALIGLMMGIGVPKFRKQLAIGKDTKAIAILSNLRTACELYYLETGKPLTDNPEVDINIEGKVTELEPYLDIKTFNEIKDGKLEIGGSRAKKTDADEADPNIIYGGEIELTFKSPETGKKGDGVYIWFKPEVGKDYDTKGNKWIEY